MSVLAQISDDSEAAALSVALIEPNDQRRHEVAGALAEFRGTTVREYSSFPPVNLDELSRLLGQHYDAVIIGLDSDPEYALDMVESLCATDSVTVMVYSCLLYTSRCV